MSKLWGLLRLAIAMFVALNLVVVTTRSIEAHALSLPLKQQNHAISKAKDPRPQCTHLMVYLHGSKPSTWKCLDSRTHPFIYATDCSYSTLYLVNYSSTNWTLCFLGNGSVNMTDFCGPWWVGGCLVNWNDQADYYTTGCSPVYFYSDINEGGTESFAPGHSSHAFNGGWNGYGNTLYDNTLSSLVLTSSCNHN